MAMENVDKGWSWIVLMAMLCCNMLVTSNNLSTNIYYVIFLNEFGESRAFTAWYGSFYLTMLFFSGALGSVLLPKIGIRNAMILAGLMSTAAFLTTYFSHSLLIIIIFFGVLGGMSNGIVLTALVAAIAKYFSRYLYMASAVSLIGAGVGVLTYAPLLEWLFESYGWRGGTLIYSALSLHYCVGGLTILPSPKKKNAALNLKQLQHSTEHVISQLNHQELKPLQEERLLKHDDDDNNTTTHCELSDNTCQLTVESESLQDDINSPPISKMNEDEKLQSIVNTILSVNFALLSYGVFTWGFSTLTFIGVYKDFLQSIGYVQYFKQCIVGFASANVLARIVITIFSFKYIVLLYAIILFIAGVVLILFAFIHQFWSLMTASCFVGFTYGAAYSMTPISVGAIYGRKRMAVIYGYVLVFLGIPCAFNPSLVGYLRDVTGSYNLGFILLGVVQLTGSFASGLLQYRLNKNSNTDK